MQRHTSNTARCVKHAQGIQPIGLLLIRHYMICHSDIHPRCIARYALGSTNSISCWPASLSNSPIRMCRRSFILCRIHVYKFDMKLIACSRLALLITLNLAMVWLALYFFLASL